MQTSFFNIKSIQKCCNIAIISHHDNKLKNLLCKSLLNHFNNLHIPVGIAITRSNKTELEYADFFPDTFIHNESKCEDIIKNILFRQEKIIMRKQQIDPSTIILYDTCIGDYELEELLEKNNDTMLNKHLEMTSSFMESLINNRCYLTTHIYITNNLLDKIKYNFDFIFILNPCVYSIKKYNLENIQNVLEKNDCIVMDNFNNLFLYEIPNVEKFVFGSAKFK